MPIFEAIPYSDSYTINASGAGCTGFPDPASRGGGVVTTALNRMRFLNGTSPCFRDRRMSGSGVSVISCPACR